MEISPALKKALQEKFSRYARSSDYIIIAFSGGVDSALVLKFALLAAKEAKERGQIVKVQAVTAKTKLHPASEGETAKKMAREMGADHSFVEVDELNEAKIGDNPPDRCYRCKKTIFSKIISLAKENLISCAPNSSESKFLFLDGSNFDDFQVYRPGLKALAELDIKSPLAELGLKKDAIRALAAAYGLASAKKPAQPCLATRLPYGAKLDYQLLERIDGAEKYIRSLGFYNVRLRLHGDVARLEVDEADIAKIIAQRETIAARLKKAGFLYIALDLEGFRSGSMDEKITT